MPAARTPVSDRRDPRNEMPAARTPVSDRRDPRNEMPAARTPISDRCDPRNEMSPARTPISDRREPRNEMPPARPPVNDNGTSFRNRTDRQDAAGSSEKQENVPLMERIISIKNKKQYAVKFSVLALCIVFLSWLLPSANIMYVSNSNLATKNRDSFFSNASVNLLSNSISDIHKMPRVFTLEMYDYLTPKPDSSKFTKIEDEERKNYDGSPIDYYKDDTIEVKCWNEKTRYGIMTYAEVWIAHPSQFRRTFVDNVISKKHKDFPENIFRKTNGILGMSGDYCAFRPYGIEIQYGNLLRDEVGSHLTPKMDILVYDINGNFSIYESTKDFFNTDVYKNKEIIHTLAFGPMLIDDYKISSNKDKLYKYQNGTPAKAYPRAAICQFGYDKHYLLCRLGLPGASLENFAKEIKKKGVRLSYALDGGQTGTIMFNKKLVNIPAYKGTREMSDIIYFATAFPDNTDI